MQFAIKVETPPTEGRRMNEWQRMIPNKFTRKLRLPVSFDVKEHRGRNYLAIFTLMAAVFIALLIFTIGFLLSNRTIFVKFLIVPIWYLVILLYRFIVFKEGKISDAYEQQKETDFQTPLTDIWNAYDIDDKHPYVVHYMNNYKGIFIRFKKDVVQGKVDDIEFDHYNAITSAYQKAHDLGLTVVPIDYMDNVGNDPRLDKLYTNAERGSNPEIENMLLGVYSNLKNLMSQEFSSFDVVLLYMRTTPDDLWFRVRQVLEEYSDANYKSFELLNSTQLLILVKELYNLEDFSIYEAEKQVLDTRASQVLRPILLVSEDGQETKLNMTFEEEEIEKDLRRKAEEDKKQKARDRRKHTPDTEDELAAKRAAYRNKDVDNQVLDLFDTGTPYVNLHAQADKSFITQEQLDKDYQTTRAQRKEDWLTEVVKQDTQAQENLSKELDLF